MAKYKDEVKELFNKGNIDSSHKMNGSQQEREVGKFGKLFWRKSCKMIIAWCSRTFVFDNLLHLGFKKNVGR